MKLYELLDVYDYDRDSETQKIQICRPDSDWEDCDEVLAGSVLLLPLYNAKVKVIGAVGEDIIRVDIEWDEKIFDWGESKRIMKKDLTIGMEEECVTCPMLSLKTDTVYFDNRMAYKIHQCEHIDFCKRVRENWEKHHNVERKES